MGRTPCCDKANVKRGPWSPEEDNKLKSYIEKHGTGGNWIALPQKIGLKRCGKSCRLRWLNYLRPNLKHGSFSEEEDNIICSMYISIGSRWSVIAAQLPGRTDNDIKNYWNTRLKKKFFGRQRKEQQARKGHGIKLEMKRENDNPIMISSSENIINNQNLYWPELPDTPARSIVPFSNQEPCFNDHTSIKKLLIKLGERFSNEDNRMMQSFTNHQFQPYDQIMDFSSPASTSAGTLNNNAMVQFAQTQYSNVDWTGLQMLQGQSNFHGGNEELAYNNNNKGNNNAQRLDGLEFLLGDDMLHYRPGSIGDMSSLIYSAVALNCQDAE